jgi:hypothetical protein
MRARPLISIAALLAVSVSAVRAESPHEIALRIISSAPSPIYSPTKSTAEELDRAAGFSSDAQLNKFMLTDSVLEEIRVCYAMHLLVGRLLLARDLSDSKLARDYRNDLRRDHEVLAKYLRQLNEHTR